MVRLPGTTPPVFNFGWAVAARSWENSFYSNGSGQSPLPFLLPNLRRLLILRVETGGVTSEFLDSSVVGRFQTACLRAGMGPAGA
jgi:hypothetical protein